MEVRPRQPELAPQPPPEQRGLLPLKLAEVELKAPAVVDEDGVLLGDLLVVMEVKPGDVLTVGHEAGVQVDGRLPPASTLWIGLRPELGTIADNKIFKDTPSLII